LFLPSHRAWNPCNVSVTVAARDYLAITKSVELSEADGSKQVDFALERGSRVFVEFVWPSGQRIVRASVFEGVARDGHNPGRIHTLDPTGLLALRVAPDETRLLYVLPQEGSFAPVRVAANRSGDEAPLRVTIPQATGKLRLTLKDAGGNDAFGLVVMRYNGEWVPYPITARLPTSASPGLLEFTALPAGAYELWAISPPTGGEGIPSTTPTHPPVRVGVGAGESSAELIVIPGP
jgi:hypothetical protein